jgi:thymidylate synthase
MKAYHDLVRRVLENGVHKTNRTGTDTISSFAEFYKVDLSEGFPLLTTKKMHFRSVIMELLWYLRGEDHIRWLRDENDVHIWDAWADPDGNVGPIYPVMWRRFPYPESENGIIKAREYDQIAEVIKLIKTNPSSRRMVVSAWNPGMLSRQKLPPCHVMFIFNVTGDRLNCHLTQRSGDIALGIPFNLACYAALTIAIAKETGYKPGMFAHTIVDAHIYVNHVDGLKKQLEREEFAPPQLEIADKPFSELTYEDFQLKNYQHHPFIRFEVAV